MAMAHSRLCSIIFRLLIILAIVSALSLGVAVGIAIAYTHNIMSAENYTDFDPALPSRLLDSQGRLITEFASDEKREIISIKDMPQHLIDALITREDRSFWTHPGFTLKGYARAVLGVITGRNLGGGSTITLQLAGTLYADRRDISYRRKLIELWWALQLERRFSKQEILEMYMNRMNMGPGVYGVEAASKYFFGKSARYTTVAEAAILVIQLAGTTIYNPIRNPNFARDRSRDVLNRMIELGYVSKEQADDSFALYWDNFDYTRVGSAAYYSREDKAPWFSEYVRRELEGMLYGSIDLYKDGLTIHTTLNLDHQASADKYMARYLDQVNKEYAESSTARLRDAERLYAPMAELLGLTFNLESMFFQETKIQRRSIDYYNKTLNTTVDALALMFGLEPLKSITNVSYGATKRIIERNTVEGTLVTIDNEKGHITALVGGSKFEQANQLIRATQSRLMPGSTFKPLYYSAAMDSRLFTPGTLIYDAPVVFYNEDGTPYIPLNFKGEWKGQVLAWQAMASSMNVPSVKILDAIGFDAAINRAAALLNVTSPEAIRATFPRLYPLALGIIGVTPLSMARAFAVFANQGREVTPIAIRSIADRSGRLILEPEKDLRDEQRRKGSAIQIISPQNAYLMTDLLKRVVSDGTLRYQTGFGSIFSYRDAEGKRFTLPAGGKTGTTQNWADAWTVGYTPYMTTAIWFGFDRPGNSLGVNQSGAVIAGNAWANYMSEIHRGLPFKDFIRPSSGLIEAKVCSISGLLPTEHCDEGTTLLVFYEGTQPKSYCDLHQFKSEQAETSIRNLSAQRDVLGGSRVQATLDLDLDLDALLQSLETTLFWQDTVTDIQESTIDLFSLPSIQYSGSSIAPTQETAIGPVQASRSAPGSALEPESEAELEDSASILD
jgi:penicillin-binding protein 1A